MTKLPGAALLVAMLAVGSPASGQMTGNELYELCSAPDPSINIHCVTYTRGAADAWLTAMAFLVSRGALSMSVVAKGPRWCTKGGDQTSKQGMDVALKYLRERPEARHLPAPLLIASAWAEAWPCSE